MTVFHGACAVKRTATTTHWIRQARSIDKEVVLSEYSNQCRLCQDHPLTYNHYNISVIAILSNDIIFLYVLC